jgi:NAD+ kinase
MEHRNMKFALFGNVFQSKKSAAIQQVLSTLADFGAEVFIDHEYYDFLCGNLHIVPNAVKVFSDDDFDADFVISMGGDGTFLKAASRVREKQIPILGVNMGRLGFLADVCPDDIERCVDALHNDDFSIESRALIEVSTDGESLEGFNCALNDVAILKRDSASMISIPFCSQSFLSIFPISVFIWLYITILRYLGANTTWYLQFHLECAKLLMSSLVMTIPPVLFLLGWQTLTPL